MATKLGELALRSLDDYAPDPASLSRAIGDGWDDSLADEVYRRVRSKLACEPVEDFRIDFEDGYGVRDDAEEDRDALAVAASVKEGMRDGTLPPLLGVRIKALTSAARGRALRTLDLVHTSLAEGDALPAQWVVTLPKVARPVEVEVLVRALERLEHRLGLPDGMLKLELMVEAPAALVDSDGALALGRLVRAGADRCVALHFGTYDFIASLDIVGAHQRLDHPACDQAKFLMQVATAGSGIRLSDGVTSRLPVPVHRGDALTEEQREANRRSVWAAWRLHADNVRHGQRQGFYQGWDLHPAQLPARYAAVYELFLTGAAGASERLRAFVGAAAQAMRTGDRFDDAATGQGLLNFFLRALSCGALTVEEVVSRVGLTESQLATRSFEQIVSVRPGS